MKKVLPNIFAVEIPDEVADLHFYRVNNQSIMFKWRDVKRPLNVNDVVRVDYYEGDLKNYTWPTLLFCSKDVTEDNARKVVELVNGGYRDYGQVIESATPYPDAVESFASLLKSHSLNAKNYAIIKTMHQSNHTPEQRGVDVYKAGKIYKDYKEFTVPHWFCFYDLIGPHSFKDGEDVTGRFELAYQWFNGTNWINISPEENKMVLVPDHKRIVTIPLPSKGQEGEAERKRCEYELVFEKYFGRKLTNNPIPLVIKDHDLVDFACAVHEHFNNPATTL